MELKKPVIWTGNRLSTIRVSRTGMKKPRKDIAAMANSGGGWIVFGIKEGGAANAACEIVPIAWSAAEQQRILRTAYAKVGPPVIGIEFYDIPCGDEGGGSVVMMRVPDSADAPHFARKGDNAFVAPRRNGPHTVYMSDREIERGFRERSSMWMIGNAFSRTALNVHVRRCAPRMECSSRWPPFLRAGHWTRSQCDGTGNINTEMNPYCLHEWV